MKQKYPTEYPTEKDFSEWSDKMDSIYNYIERHNFMEAAYCCGQMSQFFYMKSRDCHEEEYKFVKS